MNANFNEKLAKIITNLAINKARILVNLEPYLNEMAEELAELRCQNW